jgi:hypothetical protein
MLPATEKGIRAPRLLSRHCDGSIGPIYGHRLNASGIRPYDGHRADTRKPSAPHRVALSALDERISMAVY